ncbi:hypothetical protein WJX82_007806 [Trebouxia sp. C0006]
MALRLRVTPDRASYRPGDVLAAVVEVVTEPVSGAVQAAATHLEALQIELCASERVDLNWVTGKYRAGSSITEKDNRRVARPVLTMKPVRLCEHSTLLPGSRRLYLVRIQLPDTLPPSFKGSAVRYSYQLEAKATFAPQSWRKGTPSSTAQSSEFHSQPSTPSTDSPPQRTVQALNATSNSSPHLVRYSSSSNLKLSRGREAVGQQQRKGPGIVHVKTPVHLWPAPESAEQSQNGNGIVAGDDAEPASVSYPLDLQEPLDLCIDVTDLLDAEAEVPHAIPRRQASFARGTGDMSAKAGSGKSQFRTPTAADAANGVRDQDGALEGPSATVNGGSETPSTARSRVVRQAAPPSAGPAPSPSFAAADSGALRSYNLKVGDQPLVRLALHPPLEGRLQLGATIAGTLDFRFSQEAAQQSSAAPNCAQVVVMLETEEVVQDRWQAPSKRQTGPVRKVYDEHQELTANTILTHFMFSLPFEECPTFSTHLVQHKWVLRFEFTATYQQKGSDWGLGKTNKSPEQITWLLPILVWPPAS